MENTVCVGLLGLDSDWTRTVFGLFGLDSDWTRTVLGVLGQLGQSSESTRTTWGRVKYWRWGVIQVELVIRRELSLPLGCLRGLTRLQTQSPGLVLMNE